MTTNTTNNQEPWQIFKSPYGWGVGKNNSATAIHYFDTQTEAILKLIELRGHEFVVESCNAHDRLTKENDALRKVMEAADGVLGCPYHLDEATIPAHGISSPPQEQVVGNASIALFRYRKLQAAISEARALLNTDTGVGR